MMIIIIIITVITQLNSKHLSLNIPHHTIPYELCRCEVKDVHGLPSFVLTHYEESDTAFYALFALKKMLLIAAFSKENSAISLKEGFSVFKVFTTATRNLRVIKTQFSI